MVARLDGIRLFQLGVVGLAALVGIVAGIEPKLGVIAALGAAFALLVVNDLTFGIYAFTAVAFMEESLPGANGALSPAKGIGVLLALSWVATLTVHREHRRQLLQAQPALGIALIGLGAWTVLSAVWAEDPGAALGGAQRWVLNLTLFPILYSGLRSPRSVERLMAVFVLGALYSALSGWLGIGPEGSDDEGRLGGAGINPNQLGGLLVIGTIFALALAVAPKRPAIARTFWLGCSAVAAVALALTLSRGAIVGMIVAMLLAPLLVGPRRRLPVLLANVFVAIAAVLAVAALAPGAAAERLSSSDQTGSGRTDLWRIALRMTAAHPIAGVGSDNFRVASIHYLLRPGALRRDESIVEHPKVTHNIYLQTVAELGIVGLSLMFAIIGFCLLAALRAAGRFASAGDRAGEIIARALLIAMVGYLSAEFFSSQLYAQQLWLGLAMCPPLLAFARRTEAAA